MESYTFVVLFIEKLKQKSLITDEQSEMKRTRNYTNQYEKNLERLLERFQELENHESCLTSKASFAVDAAISTIKLHKVPLI